MKQNFQINAVVLSAQLSGVIVILILLYNGILFDVVWNFCFFGGCYYIFSLNSTEELSSE